MRAKLLAYQQELTIELENILNYWTNYTLDEINGGFIGKVDSDNRIDYSAPKGSVLNSRILWSFSAAYNQTGNQHYLRCATRAFDYVVEHFIDQKFGGVYWMVDARGNPTESKKQVYAIAFTIYAFSEYYLATKDEAVKEQVIKLYGSLIGHCFDGQNGGFFEAFTREWQQLDDLRLSDKDANEKKSMNTNLHILEAFTALYRIWPDDELKSQIVSLIRNFQIHLIHSKTGNLILFFDDQWAPKSEIVSYGHDIETAWLLLEAALVVNDKELIEEVKVIALKLAAVSKQGLDTDGSLWYEFDPSTNHIVKEKHWWVQAEAMVGFFSAWQISNDKNFLEISMNNWEFVKRSIIDHVNGEWFWGIGDDGVVMPHQDKVGVWKCPYHNVRACLELIKRIG